MGEYQSSSTFFAVAIPLGLGAVIGARIGVSFVINMKSLMVKKIFSILLIDINDCLNGFILDFLDVVPGCCSLKRVECKTMLPKGIAYIWREKASLFPGSTDIPSYIHCTVHFAQLRSRFKRLLSLGSPSRNSKN